MLWTLRSDHGDNASEILNYCELLQVGHPSFAGGKT